MFDYLLMSSPDNDSYWISDRSTCCCPVCGSKLTRDISGKGFYLKKKSYDLSITYDGFYVASNAFREFCEERRIGGISFARIDYDKRYSSDFFMMEVDGRLSVDVERASPVFGERCSSCGQHRYIVAPKIYDVVETVPHRGIWRSDLEFAEGVEKTYVIYVGSETASDISNMNFNGINFSQ